MQSIMIDEYLKESVENCRFPGSVMEIMVSQGTARSTGLRLLQALSNRSHESSISRNLKRGSRF